MQISPQCFITVLAVDDWPLTMHTLVFRFISSRRFRGEDMASCSRAVLITTAARANRVRSKKTGHKKRTDVWFHRLQGCFINTTTQRLISSRRASV